MNTISGSLEAMKRVLKKTTINAILTDDRVTSHGLNILERWCQKEPSVVGRLERNPQNLITVLLEQQSWEHPSSYDCIQSQLSTGLAWHELRELGAPDLSCSHALWRMALA